MIVGAVFLQGCSSNASEAVTVKCSTWPTCMRNAHKPKTSENADINWIIRTDNVFFPETLKFYFHGSFARKHGSTSLETEERDVM